MSNKLKFCKKCRERNVDEFENGYYIWLMDDCYECPMKDCGGVLVDIDMSKEDYSVITNISKDVSFLEAMISLKEKDPIEYQLKMNQLRQGSLVMQQAKQESNKPKCPTCGSTNIKKISVVSKAGSVAMWGLLSRKVHKQWHCNNCGSEW